MTNIEAATQAAAGADKAERIFMAAALWLCAAGAVFLLLSPAAFNRRALAVEAERFESEAHREWLLNVALERRRNGLESDPSAIESEARKLGYGRLGEKAYPLSAAEWKAARPRADAAYAPDPGMLSALGRGLFPALMLIITGAIAALFFTDLKVPEPRDRGGPGAGA